MVLGIIAAMEEELQPLLGEMKAETTRTIAHMTFHEGYILDKKVVAVISGIGKVNSAICAQILITTFGATKVINVGVAGGVGDSIAPGDVVIADSLIQHDMNATAFGYPHGQIPRMSTFDFKCDAELIELAKKAIEGSSNFNSFIGTIVTGDEFVANVDKIRWLKDSFNALACEMEGGSIAQACYLNDTPCVVIRSISDNANTGAHMDYEKFKPIAVENSTAILKSIIANI